MNFFERQTQARNQTRRLVYLMTLSIVSLVILTALPFVFSGFEDYLSGTGTLADAFLAMAIIASFISSIVVIGGLITATLLTLVVLPVLYVVWFSKNANTPQPE